MNKVCDYCGVRYDGLEAQEMCADCELHFIEEKNREEQWRQERLAEFEASQPIEDPRDWKYYREQSEL